MQGGYIILAARCVGLDCGPMSGFNIAMVDAEFFAGTGIKSSFLCNLGYGDASKVMPRSPRPAFDEVCKLLQLEHNGTRGHPAAGANEARDVQITCTAEEGSRAKTAQHAQAPQNADAVHWRRQFRSSGDSGRYAA